MACPSGLGRVLLQTVGSLLALEEAQGGSDDLAGALVIP
jgi:hypothetical protein